MRDFSIGNGQIPADVSGNFVLDVKTLILTGAGTYNLASSAENTTDVLFGVRFADIRETLSWSLAGNIGSLLALLGYPLIIESRFSLADQSQARSGWRGGR